MNGKQLTKNISTTIWISELIFSRFLSLMKPDILSDIVQSCIMIIIAHTAFPQAFSINKRNPRAKIISA